MASFFRQSSRRPSLTLAEARKILDLEATATTTTKTTAAAAALTKEDIQHAFRKAAKRSHPDALLATATTSNATNTNTIRDTTMCTEAFRQVHQARELLLNHYIHKKKLPHNVYDGKAATDTPSFRLELLARASLFGLLGFICFYRDYHVVPKLRKQALQQREAQFMAPGPSRPTW